MLALSKASCYFWYYLFANENRKSDCSTASFDVSVYWRKMSRFFKGSDSESDSSSSDSEVNVPRPGASAARPV